MLFLRVLACSAFLKGLRDIGACAPGIVTKAMLASPEIPYEATISGVPVGGKGCAAVGIWACLIVFWNPCLPF